MSKIKTIDDIIKELKNQEFEISYHAVIRMFERNIDLNKIIKYADTFEIIEDYPEDKYSHSCLLFGILFDEPIHIHITRSSEMKLKIITVYQPDRNIWSDDYRRRKI